MRAVSLLEENFHLQIANSIQSGEHHQCGSEAFVRTTTSCDKDPSNGYAFDSIIGFKRVGLATAFAIDSRGRWYIEHVEQPQ